VNVPDFNGAGAVSVNTADVGALDASSDNFVPVAANKVDVPEIPTVPVPLDVSVSDDKEYGA
jgi:hypothetical protein